MHDGLTKQHQQPQHQVPLFSLQDMRFFQHFLLNCYPHHPIGSEELWTHEIPCLSEKACSPLSRNQVYSHAHPPYTETHVPADMKIHTCIS